MDPQYKIMLVLFALLVIGFFFVPIAANPNSVDCEVRSDSTGGYDRICKDTHISLYTKHFRSK